MLIINNCVNVLDVILYYIIHVRKYIVVKKDIVNSVELELSVHIYIYIVTLTILEHV